MTSAVTVHECLEGERLDVLDRPPVLGGQPDAVVELGRGVEQLAVAARNLHPHRSERRLDGDEFAVETFARHLAIAHANGGGLPEDDAGEALAAHR
jgi:hypothetical protein